MVIQIETSDVFDKWLRNLKDLRAKAKILTQIKRLEMGNFGHVKAVGEGISELKITEGKGYRVYFQNHNGVLVILLCGGDKSTQSKDIKLAKKLAKERGVNHGH